MTWVHLTSSDGKTLERTTDLDGSTWAAAMTPLALALLAAIAASFAVRGWALRVVGLLVALVAVAVAVPAVQLLVSGASADRAVELAELSGHPEDLSTTVSVLPALLALVGAVAALGAAVLLMRKPPVRGGLSSKYDNPAARREAAAKLGQGDKPASDEPVTQRMLWDALDAGEDPTATDGDDGVGGDNGAKPGSSH
ncbi:MULTISPECIES: TIGR02234 family membrane protein [Rhodococcus]|uniref:TIGR02234 family membrane protein n=2 Tax=Rhodococcus TaxID=1827 RepID=A0AAW6LEP4_RHOSG|nr:MULTISPECIES: TIGR02234 family membrane protein [Rhodococcus]MCJ0946723.1 TIGR02234 family membrane protein [Rhodococcus sp. ARC_M8]MDE8645149.1 TIGR02234 family membrane protein [Rhodococcus qingshengii]MDF3319273.1 TIGR02234 family membrane protein [Rhodococcus sp. C3V]MDT9665150.1 TIGR02234 family membrane protein [Rhodococcus qingshengii]MEA1794936.1 TIGR02234 family membrane protein [Rhodococcus qingshengii]